MKRLYKLINWNNGIVVLYGITLVLVLLRGPSYFPDSYAHINMHINRSILYSLFVNIPSLMWHQHNGYAMIAIQFLVFVCSTEYFLKQVKDVFNLSSFAYLCLVLVFCFIAIAIHPFVNFILSEALAYPLLIICIGLVINLWKNASIKQLIYFFIAYFLLIVTRNHFAILLPVFLIPLVWRMKSFTNVRFASTILFLIILTPFLSKLTERIYYNITLKEDIGYTMTYVHLIGIPFYVSSLEDQHMFQNEEELAFFVRTKRLMDKKHLSYNYAKKNSFDELTYFQDNFSNICNQSVHEANLDYYKNKGLSIYDQHREVDKITSKLFFPLLKANFINWSKIVLKGFKRGLGGQGAMIILVFVIIGIVFYQYDLQLLSLFIFWILVMKLAHHFFIALVGSNENRYLFYFDWVIPFFIIIMADKLLIFKKLINKDLINGV